jgi:CRP/FNR family transcriptional activator FtrB
MGDMQDGLVLEPGRFAPTAEDRRRLRHLPLLGEMGDEPGAQLIAAASVVSFAKDQEILREGAKPTAMLTVLNGKVALVAKSVPGPIPGSTLGSPSGSASGSAVEPVPSSSQGQYAVLGLLNPGDIVMPATVVETMPYPLSAIAIEPTRVASIPIAVVRAAMEQDPRFAAMLTRSAAESWRQAIGLLTDQRLLSAPQRFAAHLTRLAGGRRGRVCFEIGEDRKTLASLLGMTPENLSRTIGQLKAIGITLNGRRVEIADVAAAAAYAQNRAHGHVRGHGDETAPRN